MALKVASLKDLNVILRGNLLYANGKNCQVDHLHATVAESRFAYENLYGIYLTNPAHAWMAVWMAVTNRNVLKKRQLEYYRPDMGKGDYMGQLGVHLPGSSSLPPAALVEKAYLYFFDPDSIEDVCELDVSRCSASAKMDFLSGLGFCLESVNLRGRSVTALVPDLIWPMIVSLDDWQAAIVNAQRLEPVVEVALLPSLVAELRERIVLIDHEPGEDYIRPSLS